MNIIKIQPGIIDETKDFTFNAVTVTGNISANYITGNGSLLTGNVANASFATTAGTVTASAQSNITSVGTLTSLSVTGNVTAGNVIATHYGAATGLTSIPGANVTGTVANATFATSAGSANAVAGANVTGTVANATYAVTAGSVSSIDGANVTGTVANATFATTAGTVTSAAQSNITSVGTLTSLNITGNLATGNTNAGLNLLVTGSSSGNVTLIAQSAASGTLTLPNGTDTVVARATTDTLTNKRVTPRVANNGATTSGTITPTGDTADQFELIGLTGSITVATPSGTPTDGQRLLLRLKDNGTARAITWSSNYRVIGVTLPSATVVNKVAYVGCIYNTQDSYWDVVAVGQQA